MSFIVKEIQQNALCFIDDQDFITHNKFTYDEKENIYHFSCHFNSKIYDKALFKELNILFPQQLETSVAIRQAEFLAGRFAAKEVLLRSGLSKNTPPAITIGKQRNPIWPSNIIGSISHTHSHAMCTISLKQHNCCIGIDIENYMSDELAKKIGQSIYLASEIEKLTNEKLPYNIASTLIFSAKESLFKALYPLIGRYFDFDCALVTQFSLQKKMLYLKLSRSLLNETVNIAEEYCCNFTLLENSLITTINHRK